jgi:hypothetical protein
MNVLVVAGREPRHDGKGDQVRAAQLIDALAPRHAVTVVTPAGRSRAARALSLLGAVLAGAPAQVGWFRPWGMRRRVQALACCHDVVVFITVRTFVPGVESYVLDHIDALSLNMSRRAERQRFWPARLAWRAEARRLRAFEQRAAARARAQIVTSVVDADHVPAEPRPACIPIGVDLPDAGPVHGHAGRDIDLILTGNMRYPPNRHAAALLAHDIAPLVRRRRQARIAVVGRAAHTVAQGADVDRVADVPDIAPFLARAKVAMAPIDGGTGVPIKVLEAARAGAAVVLTPQANAGLGFSADAVVLATTPGEFADQALALLDDEEDRVRRVEALWRELGRFALDDVMAAYEQILEAVANVD